MSRAVQQAVHIPRNELKMDYRISGRQIKRQHSFCQKESFPLSTKAHVWPQAPSVPTPKHLSHRRASEHLALLPSDPRSLYPLVILSLSPLGIPTILPFCCLSCFP